VSEGESAHTRVPDVYTIGHSTHAFADVMALLAGYRIEILADIRSRPYMNFFPEFNRRRMKMRLAAAGIIYVFMGDLLGELPRGDRSYRCSLGGVDLVRVEASATFQKGLAWLLEESRHSRICLFCGEADPLDCHRHHLVGQALVARGLQVHHILADGRTETAQPDLFHQPDGVWRPSR
jgi:uncharacterized protein (DUF488 family)